MAHVALQMRRAGREVVERHLKERRRLREICEWLGTWGVGEAGKTVVVGCMAGKGGGADREIDHTEMLQSVKTAFKQFFFSLPVLCRFNHQHACFTCHFTGAVLSVCSKGKRLNGMINTGNGTVYIPLTI